MSAQPFPDEETAYSAFGTFVLPVEKAHRIRTAEEGTAGVTPVRR